ncbi:uncharacterized protein [Hyperolius riggenbachi]|uniref:uncharacterized protein n=1 Tax=Hyperolius riggenbachi TaxID=752182 RepID=UPI0035A3A0AA
MSSSRVLSLLLSLQLLQATMGATDGGNTTTASLTTYTDDSTASPTITSANLLTTPTRTTSKDQTTKKGMDVMTQTPLSNKSCAWWCQETYGIIIAAGLGGLFLSSVVLFTCSCCLWRSTKSPAVPCGVTEMEMQSLRTAEEHSVMPTSDAVKAEPLVNNAETVRNVEDSVSDKPPEAQEKTSEASAVITIPPNNDVDPPAEATEAL